MPTPQKTADSTTKPGKPTDKEVIEKRSRDGRQRWHSCGRRPELLTVGELAKLDLGCELVVLSACHSLGDGSVDGDWLNGLTRAFLVAGSSGVVCTAAETPDQIALSMVSGLYYAMLAENDTPGLPADAARALQQLKLSLLPSPKYGHPSVWAPWVYHGRAPSN